LFDGMSLALLTSRDAVLEAIAEFDALGRDQFLHKYGYGRADAYFLVFEGREYDSKAIAGVAVGYEHSDRGPLRASEFVGGAVTVQRKLEALGYEVVKREVAEETQTHAWWVNQGGTFEQERAGNYVWAPEQGEGGRLIAHHQDVAKLQPGDIVFHYAKGLVRAVGVVDVAATMAARPAELPEGPWADSGYLAQVTYHDAPTPIALEEIPTEWRLEDGGPFTRHGSVKQGYLFPLSERFVQHFRDEFKSRWPALSELLHQFASTASGLSEFLSWGRRFGEIADFDQDERDYKIAVAGQLRGIRDTLRAGGDWKPAFIGMPSDNLLSWQVRDRLKRWVHDSPAADEAFGAIWKDGDAADRGRQFLQLLPADIASGRGERASVAVYFLLVDGAEDHPPYRPTPFEKAYSLTGYPTPDGDRDEIDIYQHSLRFLDDLRALATESGYRLRDRLDGQSLVWILTKAKADEEPLTSWPAQMREAFLRYRGDLPPLPLEETGLSGLASSLLLDVAYLQEIERLVRDKGQVIFYGPPGTGKTYVARQLALHFARSSDRLKLVQFHPSYAYEDFVEGYRPAELNGQPGFSLSEGPFKSIADAAREAPDEQFVLIIDEINRGNVAKVFGELYFLLEYRDERIQLQYSTDEFALPGNLWLFGTMNTADRSIALLDAALRRRFYFIPFFPDEPPVQGLLRRWLEANKPDLVWVADVVDRANTLLDDRNSGIGPSYFMRANLSEEWVELIWSHAIVPYLGEQLFGEDERLAEFELDRLRYPFAERDETTDDGDSEQPGEASQAS
jgi:hypothetical protein